MCFGKIEGAVPVPGGTVDVKSDGKTATVRSDIAGGVLVIGDRRIDIPQGETIEISI